MRATLIFIVNLLTHLDRLVIGYETTITLPDGERFLTRYLRVGRQSEMEIRLESGELVKSRDGSTTVYRELEEDEP